MPTWDLSDIHGPQDGEKLAQRLRELTSEFAAKRPVLEGKPSEADFMGFIRLDEDMADAVGRLSAYAGLRLAEDTSDPKRTAYEGGISQMCAEAANDVMFFSIWLRDLDEAEYARRLASSGKYRYHLERVRAFRKHILSERDEQIINLKDLTGSEAQVRLYDMITGRYRFRFRGKSLTYDQISEHKLSPRRADRTAAYDVTLARLAEDGPVLGEIYRTLANDWRNENQRLRGFASPIAPVNLANDVMDRAVDALLKSVKDNRRLFQEYFRLKGRLCGIGRMDRYDIYAPYRSRERAYSFAECKRMTLETYRSLDERAYILAKRIFDERHVHSDPSPNKQPGAFCHTTVLGVTPYVLLNHNGTINDLFTMVHEVGHGVHTQLAHAQTQLTYHPGLPLAETASVFGEMLLARRLMEAANPRERVALMVRSIDRQYATVTRQAYFTMFEIEAHKAVSEGASTEDLDAIYLRNLREQLGRLPIPESFRHEWKGIQHIYYSPFYCYSYALANTVVLALYRQYLLEGAEFVPKYLRMLGLGGSESPATILGEAGLDMGAEGFWQGGFDAIREEMRQLRKLAA
jgi:oligoendopeptidase F